MNNKKNGNSEGERFELYPLKVITDKWILTHLCSIEYYEYRLDRLGKIMSSLAFCIGSLGK